MSVGVHIAHCCVLHGCKYGDKVCPVVQRRAKQEFRCEQCDDEGLSEIPNPDHPDYDVLRMNEFELRDEVIRLRKLVRE